jgi:single-strand DNA-binding protein
MARTKSTAATARKPKASAPEAPEREYPEDTVLVGRLCADPKLRHTASGKAVANLRIAVNPPEGDPSFHSVVTWGPTAEVVCRFLKKGRLVEVKGHEQTRDWTDRDGNARQTTEISAYRVTFLSGRRPSSSAPEAEKAVA